MKIFEEMLREAGVPVTEAEMNAKWQELNEAQGHQITNNSKWSPFWRLITAIVTHPCKKLVELLVHTALPNTFLKYAKDHWLDVFAWGVDVVRKEETCAIGQVEFLRETATGELRIPAKTIIESPRINNYVYQVEVTQDTVCPDGVVRISLPVRAVNPGSAYNLGPGYYSILPKPVPGIVSVINQADWLTSPGADRENDEELRMRTRNQFSAVGQYHHDAAYRACIAAFAGIRVDYIYFAHGAPRGPGSANAYIMQESGTPPKEFVDGINKYIRDSGNHGHGDDMLCFPMPEAPQNLVAIIYAQKHASEEQIKTLATQTENIIRCAFRQNEDWQQVTKTRPWSRFSLSQLDKELHAHLPDLKSIEFDRAGDIVTDMALPTLQKITVKRGE